MKRMNFKEGRGQVEASESAGKCLESAGSIGVRGGVSGVSGDTPVGLETSGSLEVS